MKLGLQNKINRSNNSQTDGWGRVLQLSHAERAVLNLARGRPYELPGPREQI